MAVVLRQYHTGVEELLVRPPHEKQHSPSQTIVRANETIGHDMSNHNRSYPAWLETAANHASDERDSSQYDFLSGDLRAQPKSTRLLGIGMEFPMPRGPPNSKPVGMAEYLNVFKPERINPFKNRHPRPAKSYSDLRTRREKHQDRAETVSQRIPSRKVGLGGWETSDDEDCEPIKGLDLKPWEPLNIAKKSEEVTRRIASPIRTVSPATQYSPPYSPIRIINQLEFPRLESFSPKSENQRPKLRKSQSTVQVLPAVAYRPEFAPTVPPLPGNRDSWEIYELPDSPLPGKIDSTEAIPTCFSHRYRPITPPQSQMPLPLRIKTPDPYSGGRPPIPPMFRECTYNGNSLAKNPVGSESNSPTQRMSSPVKIPSPVDDSPGFKSTWSEDSDNESDTSPEGKLHGSISKAKGVFKRMGSKEYGKPDRNSSASKVSTASTTNRQQHPRWFHSPTNSVTRTNSGPENFYSGKANSHSSPTSPSGFASDRTSFSQKSGHTDESISSPKSAEERKSPSFRIPFEMSALKNLKKLTLSAEKRAEMEAEKRREALKATIRVRRREKSWESDYNEEDRNAKQN
ncbi:hypothetical protein EDC01DRAFT_463522 [Geopyxis carbonaria]|nr:hypothetical protein EDC01DRAFT_463522 [Geopyxis carbonaria]